MKTLFVLRHAKSSWKDANLADFDRPLNKRGLRAAPLMGKFMREKGFEPSIIISSPAERAKQTAVLAKEGGGFSCEILFEKLIYEDDPQILVEVVSRTDDAHASALLVGHSPCMEGVSRLLTGDSERMPTAALAVIELNVNKWNEIGEGSGKLQGVYRPKELTS